MKAIRCILFFAMFVLLTACKTTEVKPLGWKEQSVWMAGVRDPRRYGYSIYQTPAGVDYRGGCRLHPNQGAVLTMDARDPVRPVVSLRGEFGLSAPVLFDLSSSSSWMEFDLASKLGAQPVAETKAQLVKLPAEETPGCLSVIPKLRFKQLHIENPLVYVRMARGPIGTLARDIEDPQPKGVFGWDLLKRFEQIQLDYSKRNLLVTTVAGGWQPDPSLQVASLPLVRHAGSCSIRGAVNGKESLVIIDPAGDFTVAAENPAEMTSLVLGGALVVSTADAVKSPGGTRVGARLLKDYLVTICPKEGTVYFEKPGAEAADGTGR